MSDDKNLLLDIPAELADQIAHCLPKEDLFTLRRVSKNVAARRDRAVLPHILSSLENMFCSRSSLELAQLISKNLT